MSPRVYPPRRTQIATRIDPALLDAINTLAVEDGSTRNEMVRQLLSEAVARRMRGTTAT